MTTMKTTSDNPWDELPRSDGRGAYNTRMVAGDINPAAKKIYWAKGRSGFPALLVEYGDEKVKNPELPRFRNISICDLGESRSILLELQDWDMKSPFLRLCLDIAESIQQVPPTSVRKMTLMRLEKWASFLRPGRGVAPA